ncbi:uncharacterized protein LOC127851491 [Dreissena polymorpha]|uniref:Claudin n=1 Tax=Dreissena polymorpha TaxID=45954 RepID=A0A9D4HSH8_DREPO|nr:uncharacterized protein LOC127851491 [Dreissena polymorpha]KAH3733390.1 hypothetical protein DPMN_039817 [Dreissena polymorpha]
MNAKIAVVLSVIACVINIIGLAIPYWRTCSMKLKEFDFSVGSNYGLWIFCGYVDAPNRSFRTCSAYDHPEITSSTNGILQARYIELVASILVVCSTIMGLVQTVSHTPKVLYTKPSGVMCIIAGILALVGCIVFATTNIQLQVSTYACHYHAGFALCIVAGVMSLVSGVLYMLARKNTQDYYNTPLI